MATGDKVKTGSLIMVFEVAGAAPVAAPVQAAAAPAAAPAQAATPAAAAPATSGEFQETMSTHMLLQSCVVWLVNLALT